MRAGVEHFEQFPVFLSIVHPPRMSTSQSMELKRSKILGVAQQGARPETDGLRSKIPGRRTRKQLYRGPHVDH